jgi:hypothetical protein
MYKRRVNGCSYLIIEEFFSKIKKTDNDRYWKIHDKIRFLRSEEYEICENMKNEYPKH